MLRRILGPFSRSKDFFKVQARRLSTELTQANGNARLKIPSTVPFSVYATGATLAVGGSVAWLRHDLKETQEDVKTLTKEVADFKVEVKKDMANLRQDMADLKLDLKQDIAELKVLFFQDKAQKLEEAAQNTQNTQASKVK